MCKFSKNDYMYMYMCRYMYFEVACRFSQYSGSERVNRLLELALSEYGGVLVLCVANSYFLSFYASDDNDNDKRQRPNPKRADNVHKVNIKPHTMHFFVFQWLL